MSKRWKVSKYLHFGAKYMGLVPSEDGKELLGFK